MSENNLEFENYESLHQYNEDNSSLPICTRPWTRLYVSADGKCWNCCYQTNPFYIIDKNSSIFEEVWNNENIKFIRSSLLKGKLPTEFCDCINRTGGIPTPDPSPVVEFDYLKEPLWVKRDDKSISLKVYPNNNLPKINNLPEMNTIRTAGYGSSKADINSKMTSSLFKHIQKRQNIYNTSNDVLAEWLLNRNLAIKERNERKIQLTCNPLYLDIELNNMCNLKCEFCTCIHGHVRQFNSPDAMLTKAEIDQISPLFQYAETMETSKAGEPFITPDLFLYALEKIRFVNPFVIISTVTNGTILTDELLNGIIHNKLDHIYISISGDNKEQYNEIMGGDMFEKVVQNIKKIQQKKEERHSLEPFLHFNTQLSKYCDPFTVLDIAHQYGVIEVNFIKTHMSRGNAQFKGSPFQDYLTPEEIDKIMNGIVKKANDLKISINFPGWGKRNDKIIGSPQEFYYPHVTKYFDLDLTCPTDAPWFRYCTVMRYVQPCCWSGPFENWTKKPFEEIWNGTYLQDLRKKLSSNEYPSVCHCKY